MGEAMGEAPERLDLAEDPMGGWWSAADAPPEARVEFVRADVADRHKRERDEALSLLNTPLFDIFTEAVAREAAHQRHRWGTAHDVGKEPQDWFWLVGYLSGKALRAHIDGDEEKAKHHTISSAAALLNWHAAIIGEHTQMRPGHGEEMAAIAVAEGPGE